MEAQTREIRGKWTGPYKIVPRERVNYRVVPTKGKILIAHHNLLKACPIIIDKGTPFYPTYETPGIAIVKRDKEGLEASELVGGKRGTARTSFLRQAVNPPTCFGNAIIH